MKWTNGVEPGKPEFKQPSKAGQKCQFWNPSFNIKLPMIIKKRIQISHSNTFCMRINHRFLCKWRYIPCEEKERTKGGGKAEKLQQWDETITTRIGFQNKWGPLRIVTPGFNVDKYNSVPKQKINHVTK